MHYRYWSRQRIIVPPNSPFDVGSPFRRVDTPNMDSFFGGDFGIGESLARPTTAGERSVIIFLLTAVFTVLGLVALYRGFTVPFNPEFPNEARNLFITGGASLAGAVMIWFGGRAFVRWMFG